MILLLNPSLFVRSLDKHWGGVNSRWVTWWPIMSNLHPFTTTSHLTLLYYLPHPSVSHPSLALFPISPITLSPPSHLSLISLSSSLSSLVHNFTAVVKESHSFHQSDQEWIFLGRSLLWAAFPLRINHVWPLMPCYEVKAFSSSLFSAHTSLFFSWGLHHNCTITIWLYTPCHLCCPLAVLWIGVKQERRLGVGMGACQSVLGRAPKNIFVEWGRKRKWPDVWREA